MLCILSVTNFAIIRDIVAREGRQDIQRIVSLSVLHSGQNSIKKHVLQLGAGSAYQSAHDGDACAQHSFRCRCLFVCAWYIDIPKKSIF
jgi:hypothetical protein